MVSEWHPNCEPVPGYHLIDPEPFAVGGAGAVWRAIGPGGIRVVLKRVILNCPMGDAELKALELIRSLSGHPHLLSLHGFWVHDDELVIASELASGSLKDRLKPIADQGIPVEELLDYMEDAAKGLDFLNAPVHHLDGKQVAIQHRDVKPDNLLLVGGSVKVSDFGLAKALEKQTGSHTGAMTMAYAAPEFFAHEVSNRSDQYSLAASYVHLRTGQCIFQGSAAQIMYGHLHSPPNLSGLGEAEAQVVVRALAKDPGERFGTCREFVRALHRAVEAAPIPLAGTPGSEIARGSESGPTAPGPWPGRGEPVVAGEVRGLSNSAASEVLPTEPFNGLEPAAARVGGAARRPAPSIIRRVGLCLVGGAVLLGSIIVAYTRWNSKPSDRTLTTRPTGRASTTQMVRDAGRGLGVDARAATRPAISTQTGQDGAGPEKVGHSQRPTADERPAATPQPRNGPLSVAAAERVGRPGGEGQAQSRGRETPAGVSPPAPLKAEVVPARTAEPQEQPARQSYAIVEKPSIPGPAALDARRAGDEAVAPARAGEFGAPKLVLETQGFTTLVASLDFSPDGRLLAAAGNDKVVRIWDLSTGQLRFTLRGQEGVGAAGMCTAVAFSPSGRELVVGVQDYSPEGAIRVYETADWSRIAALLPGHPQGGVAQLAFSGDGKYLASLGADKEVIIWDWATRRPRGHVTVHGQLGYLGFPGKLPMLVAVDGQGYHAWSAIDGREVPAQSPEQAKALGDPEDVRAEWAAVQAMGQVFGTLEWPYRGTPETIRPYPEAGLALAGGQGTRDDRPHYWVGLWSTRDGSRVGLFEGDFYIPKALALSPDHKLVASGDFYGAIDVWQTRTGRRRYHFSGKGRPIYNVGFEASGRRLAFGTEPHAADRWGFNDYADLDQTFDLAQRRIIHGISGSHSTEVVRVGPRALKVEQREGVYALTCTRQGKRESSYTFAPGVVPMCYSFLHSRGPGFEDPLVVGRQDFMLACMDPRTMNQRREFVGHQGQVTALSESLDGRFLASSSTDRTVRIWSLENFKVYAWPDFDFAANGIVHYVVPGGSAAQAGIRRGDRFLKMDGRGIAELSELYLHGPWKYRPGQRVDVEMARGDRAYRATVALVAGGDFVDPLLSLLTTADGEWILWTPQGYYDASRGGDRLIGWQVNQGRSKAAKFYLAHQFRKQFYRPDVIDRVLQTGSVVRAIELANQDRPRRTEALDLRRPEVMKRIEPPRVRFLEPADGTRTPTNRIMVRVQATSQNQLPIGAVMILVNGRPASGKTLSGEPGDRDLERTLAQEVELLPGRNEISVLASNRKSISQPVTVAVDSAGAGPARGSSKVYLLAVGISEYARNELNLRFARRDAVAFAAAWKSQEGRFYSRIETRLLSNTEASAANIRDGLQWLMQNVTPNDVAIIFFSGHGEQGPSGDYFLATHELDPERLIATGIPSSDLERWIGQIRGTTLVFADTGHGGGHVKLKAAQADPLRELASEEVGAVLITASLPTEESQEDQRWKHGAFTKAILDTLHDPASDTNHDGYLSIAEITSQIAKRVAKLTADQQHPITSQPPTVQSNFKIYQLGGAGDDRVQ